MNQKLSDWASIAEIISSVAVVGTLTFLAFEMRSNTNAVQAQTYQTLMQELNDYRLLLTDSEWVESREKLTIEGWESLTAIEKQVLRIPSSIRWSVYESAFYANERGVLGEREWIRFEVAICRGYVAEADLWAPEGATSIPELLTPDFLGYIEESCR